MSVTLTEPNVLDSSKLAIASAFGRAASKYDQHAAFQREVANKLAAKLPADLAGLSVLDVGCGTGYLSQLLIDRGAMVTCSDISSQMLAQAEQRLGTTAANYTIQDAESLSFENHSFDIVVSSLALQWCADISTPLSEMLRVTKATGEIYFSTLLDGSLFELVNAWSKIDSYQHVNKFIAANDLKVALAQSPHSHYSLDLQKMVVWYDKALELMKDLKGIGANHVSGRSLGLTNKSALLGVEREYQNFRDTQGRLPATYRVGLGTIKR
jgi:malonyl-CoA O-methyltransferase